MDTHELQMHLALTRRYAGAIDGLWGPKTDAAVLLMMEDGPDTLLVAADFEHAAERMKVQVAAIRALWSVEAAGVGFSAGMPKILPERHRFSKLTKGRFDRSNPALSSPIWDRSWYPGTQKARYDVLLAWGRLLSAADLPIDAAFAACSYGGPQILGENAERCWVTSPAFFAEHMARDERAHLLCFEAFVANANILPALRQVGRAEESWWPVTERYNGTAHKLNGYPTKAVKEFIRFGGK